MAIPPEPALAPRTLTVAEIAAAVGGRVVGDGDLELSDVATLDEAGPAHLSFLSNPKYRKAAAASKAGALVVGEKDAEALAGRTLVVAKDPYAAFASLLERFRPPLPPPVGIAPSAWIGRDVSFGEEVSVGPSAFVGDEVVLGDRVRILPGAVVGEGSEIGEDSTIHPGVVIYPGSRVGKRVVLHAGVVIGGDGFGYATVAGVHRKIPQVGRAVIEDDVEIGPNSAIDRGALGDTVVGAGTKIDDLVMIAHGVKLGAACLMAAQSGIAGSTRLGDRVTFAGQSGAVGHIRIGSGAIVGAKSAVTHDVPDGSFVTGHPAVPHREWLEQGATVRRLPKLVDRVARLERAIEGIGEALAGLQGAIASLEGTLERVASAAEAAETPGTKPKPPAAPRKKSSSRAGAVREGKRK